MAIDEILNQAINNPECSVLLGGYIGAVGMAYYSIWIIGLLILFRIINLMIITPFCEWIKSKIFK